MAPAMVRATEAMLSQWNRIPENQPVDVAREMMISDQGSYAQCIGSGNPKVARYRVAHERQRTSGVLKRVSYCGGPDVQRSKTKACCCPGPSVMAFIRMEHEHVAEHAVFRFSPILK